MPFCQPRKLFESCLMEGVCQIPIERLDTFAVLVQTIPAPLCQHLVQHHLPSPEHNFSSHARTLKGFDLTMHFSPCNAMRYCHANLIHDPPPAQRHQTRHKGAADASANWRSSILLLTAVVAGLPHGTQSDMCNFQKQLSEVSTSQSQDTVI